jgi:hypothetical protein
VDQEVLTAVAIAVFVTMGVMVTLTRRTRERAQEAQGNDHPTAPKPRTKRQKQLVAQMAPPPEIPTIEQLVAEEAAATGVNDIPGGEGLDVSLKLRVYWRDEVVRKGCEDGHLEFRIESGVDLEAADIDDVRLVCKRGGAGAAENHGSAGESAEALTTDVDDD